MKETLPYKRKQQVGAYPVPQLERLAKIFETPVKIEMRGWYQYVTVPGTAIRVEETPIGLYVTNNIGQDLYHAKDLEPILKYCFQQQENQKYSSRIPRQG